MSQAHGTDHKINFAHKITLMRAIDGTRRSIENLQLKLQLPFKAKVARLSTTPTADSETI